MIRNGTVTDSETEFIDSDYDCESDGNTYFDVDVELTISLLAVGAAAITVELLSSSDVAVL